MPVKSEEEFSEKIIEMSKNNDQPTGALLDSVCCKRIYKLIAIDLSKQTKLKDLQEITFIGKLLATPRITMFSSLKNQKILALIFHKILSQSYK